MKKVKLMLLSLSILAVVGGALAFTAKTGTTYCTADVDSNGNCPAICPLPGKLSPVITTKFVCTTTSVGTAADPCNQVNGPAPACFVKVQKTIE